MRRLLLSLVAGLGLATALAQPAAASDLKAYVDCIKFTNRWCDLAREEANNIIEVWAVDTYCAMLILGCSFKPI